MSFFVRQIVQISSKNQEICQFPPFKNRGFSAKKLAVIAIDWFQEIFQ